MIRIFERDTKLYAAELERLARRGDGDLSHVEPAVRAIIADVQTRGDEAVRDCVARFEGRTISAIRLSDEERARRASLAAPGVRARLQAAADRIQRYHERQREPGFSFEDGGIVLGQRVRPVRAAGIYVPGGKAAYPSSMLMTAIPARVAGVKRIVAASPDPGPEVVLAAELAGVTDIIDCGGAHAIAALAYGTQSVPRVDKIVGPGNIYVACAKRLVFGAVDIDSIAGPSEILVVADDEANPRVVAADLISQAEHDEDAYPLLITLSKAQADAVRAEVEAQLTDLPRKDIAQVAFERHGACFVVRDLAEAARVASEIAAEHLALAVAQPEPLLERIDRAGAAFVGYYTPEAAGDYVAGPSHVLPTGGTVRFSSPLGVYDFVVRTSIIRYSESALKAQSDLIEELAQLEGLAGHARAVRIRTKGHL